jgi:alpha-galactosidase
LLGARNQLVLDMSLPQVRDYLFDAMAQLCANCPFPI